MNTCHTLVIFVVEAKTDAVSKESILSVSSLTSKIHTPLDPVGTFDVLGHTFNQAEAEKLLNTDKRRELLAPENGAVEVTEE